MTNDAEERGRMDINLAGETDADVIYANHEVPDLGALRVGEFDCEGAIVRLRAPLVLFPRFDGGIFSIEEAALGILVYAESRGELAEALEDELSLLWRVYAQADDSELDASAIRLKQAWLKIGDAS